MSAQKQRNSSTSKASEEEEKALPASGKPKTVILLVVMVIILGLGAGGGWYFANGRKSEAASPAPVIQSMNLESFTINLSDPGYRRYLRIRITLEYSDEKLEKELTEKGYRVRDVIISVFRSKKVDEVSNRDQDPQLRQELVQAINSILTTGKIGNVYFPEFIIQ